MRKIARHLPLFAILALTASAGAQNAVPVTLDNFIRAESDNYFNNSVKEAGLGKLFHRREPASLSNQIVIRINRDTLYSSGVFDLEAGPVTITLPASRGRFMSLQQISEDHYSRTFYGPAPRTLTREGIGTRYVLIGIRTLVDPNDPQDVRQAHALQDEVKVSQKEQGRFEIPNWDQAGLKKIRDALLVLGGSTSGFKHSFGTRDQVDPIYHLVGTAMGWGGNSEKDATYVGVTPAKNDGETVYRLNVKDVPVDGFWSVTVYNASGYLEPNKLNAYSFNNITAKKSPDGAVAIQFGGCDGKIANCLPVMKGWNYTVRLYRPRAEILSGKWKFPDPQPVSDDLVGQK